MTRKQVVVLKSFMIIKMLTGYVLSDTELKTDVILPFTKITVVKGNIILKYIIPMKLNLLNYLNG